MAESQKSQEKSAEQRVQEAEAALEAARAELADSQGELRAVKTKDVPMMVIRVKPNSVVGHEGRMYHGVEYGVIKGSKDRLIHGEDHGTDLTIDGPTAMALLLDGKVDIVKSVTA